MFIKILIIMNSSDCLSRANSGHASVAYKSMDRHLERSKSRTTYWDVKRPTLPEIALNDLKKRDLAGSQLHLSDC